MSKEHVVETDVLVIGGGLAGCFAAIKAKEQGVDVTLVDKGYVSKSGSSIWPHTYSVFNPEWGHKLDDWMDHINTGGEYLNNRVWTEIIFKESYARYQDLVSYGVEFRKDENGKLYRWKMAPQRACESLEFHIVAGERRAKSLILRKQALKSGVKIMDRIMITDLLQQDGRVIGVVGFSIDSGDLYIFKAKATVISAGAAAFKPSGWPISELTGDGMAMAYRANAELLGCEFIDTHNTWAENPAYGFPAIMRASPGRLLNAEGEELKLYPGRLRSYSLNVEFEAHAGRLPLIWEVDADSKVAGLKDRRLPVVGGSVGGMAVHTAEGIWPINTKCGTTLPGLYAAGDSCGTRQVCAVYSGVGFAFAGASVTGTRAGLSAAEYASQTEKPTIDEKDLARLKKVTLEPFERKGGFSPKWVIQVLQNILFPYYILYIKHGDRLKATLTLVEFLKDHLVPKLIAKDLHELRLAHETKNMVLNAEMRLRSSLFRTESRGCHYREDYPRRDDPNWLAWVKLKEEKGKMKLWKEPIPNEWWPDLSKPYEERYPVRFPGE
ncbi:FAD-binding protein [Candidatus Bathyarchaeota archaeon]|nr:FAD-binding protein [Candidatus Bathyarchaeota archaeon]